MKVSRKSPLTGATNVMELPITAKQITSYNSGTAVQQAFPQLTGAQREFILNGYTPEDWAAIFTPDTMTVAEVLLQIANDSIERNDGAFQQDFEKRLREIEADLVGHGMTEAGFATLKENCWLAFHRLMQEAGDNPRVAARFAVIEYGAA